MSGKGADLSGLDSFNLSDLMGGPGAAPVEAAEPENNNLLIREVPISKIHPGFSRFFIGFGFIVC